MEKPTVQQHVSGEPSGTQQKPADPRNPRLGNHAEPTLADWFRGNVRWRGSGRGRGLPRWAGTENAGPSRDRSLSIMFQVEPIHQYDDPRLAPYRNMRAQFDHLEGGVFIAEGEKVVRRLVESSCEVISVVLPPKWVAEYEPLLRARPEDIALFVAERAVLEQLTGFSMFQGVLGLARVPSASTVADLAAVPGPQLLMAMDGLTGAENVGAVVRNVAALGGQAVILGETSAHPYLRRAVRSSMGTILRVPYVVSPRLVDTRCMR